MENWITIALGFTMGYFLIRFINRKQKSPSDIYTATSTTVSNKQTDTEQEKKYSASNILTDEKYKVKGQWDK
jgi:hypothetical protein|tara:strand:+ start:259 stop:474 length:216 start_codon:yes stop_codon:yes gene_type:complete